MEYDPGDLRSVAAGGEFGVPVLRSLLLHSGESATQTHL